LTDKGEPLALARGVYWVGVIDWNLRDFHGYITPGGTTYNAYLIVDEKIGTSRFGAQKIDQKYPVTLV
jgi:hypothetical protein